MFLVYLFLLYICSAAGAHWLATGAQPLALWLKIDDLTLHPKPARGLRIQGLGLCFEIVLLTSARIVPLELFSCWQEMLFSKNVN